LQQQDRFGSFLHEFNEERRHGALDMRSSSIGDVQILAAIAVHSQLRLGRNSFAVVG